MAAEKGEYVDPVAQIDRSIAIGEATMRDLLDAIRRCKREGDDTETLESQVSLLEREMELWRRSRRALQTRSAEADFKLINDNIRTV